MNVKMDKVGVVHGLVETLVSSVTIQRERGPLGRLALHLTDKLGARKGASNTLERRLYCDSFMYDSTSSLLFLIALVLSIGELRF